jgi:ectoine hydroxylase-related dioxygenase (phytanoyl-CoA dioxygenase family)
MLEELGAHVISEHSVPESYSGDGLIAVSFDERDRDLVVDTSRARSKESQFGELEYDLAERDSQLQQMAAAMSLATGQLDQTRAELAARDTDIKALQVGLDQVAGERNAYQAQLDGVYATKLWRWARRPRDLYGRLRRAPDLSTALVRRRPLTDGSRSPRGDDLERDGYVVIPNVIDDELVAEARGHVAWLLARHPELRGEELGHELVGDDPFWVRLVGDDRILDVVEPILGPNIALFASAYIAKPPHEGLPVLWHQDAAYWPLEPMDVLTVWLALDDSRPDSGCVRVIPRSHSWGVYPIREQINVDNVLASEIDIDADRIESAEAVDLAVPAGGISIHHPSIVHASHANTSSDWRRGLTIRYIPTTTRITADRPGQPWPCAFLLRGVAVPGINSYRPRPWFVAGQHFPFRGCEEWNS